MTTYFYLYYELSCRHLDVGSIRSLYADWPVVGFFLLAGCGEVGARFYVLDKPQVTSARHRSQLFTSQLWPVTWDEVGQSFC